MSGHTPGPWQIDKLASTHVIAEQRTICSVSFHSTALSDGGNAENQANARLIAASPELLRQLLNARQFVLLQIFDARDGKISQELGDKAQKYLDDIDAALEKAQPQNNEMDR